MKKRILFVNDENSKRNICTVLIAFQKPTAIWDIKMEDAPQLAVQDLKTTCSKKNKTTQRTLQQSNTTHCMSFTTRTAHK